MGLNADKPIMALLVENIYLVPNDWSKNIYSWSEKIQDQIKFSVYLVLNRRDKTFVLNICILVTSTFSDPVRTLI